MDYTKADKTPTKAQRAGGYNIDSWTGQTITAPNEPVWKILAQRDKKEEERNEAALKMRAGYEVLFRKIRAHQEGAIELNNDQESRLRQRVGPAQQARYQELAREFVDSLGLPPGSDWRTVSDQQIRIPQDVGRSFVGRLMNTREESQFARGRNRTWSSADSSRALEDINPVADREKKDWKLAFNALTNSSAQSEPAPILPCRSTLGRPQLRLRHNPDVEPILDRVWDRPSPSSSSSSSSSVASSRSHAPPLSFSISSASSSASSSPNLLYPLRSSTSSSYTPSPLRSSPASSVSSSSSTPTSLRSSPASSVSSASSLSTFNSVSSASSLSPATSVSSAISSASSHASPSSATAVKVEPQQAMPVQKDTKADIACKICHEDIIDIKFRRVLDANKRLAQVQMLPWRHLSQRVH